MIRILRSGFIFIVIFCAFYLTGCKGDIESIEIDTNTISEKVALEKFDLNKVKLIVNKRDGSTEEVELNEELIETEDLSFLNTLGTHTIEVSYSGKTTSFNITFVESEYDINYYILQDGDFVKEDTKTFEFNTRITHINTIRKGYVLDGWYLDEDLTEPFNSLKMPSEDIDLYGKWNEYNKETIIEMEQNIIRSYYITSEYRIFAGGSLLSEFGETKKPVDITSIFEMHEDEVIIDISTGIDHSFAISSIGRVFAWGSTEFGNLGYGPEGIEKSKKKPIDITSKFNLQDDEVIVYIYANSDRHSFAISSMGRVFAWGAYEHGQIELDIRNIPNDITHHFDLQYDESIINALSFYHNTYVMTSKDRIIKWTSYSKETITSDFELEGDERIVMIDDIYNSLALSSKGRVFAWGPNRCGSIGNGTTKSIYSPLDITEFIDLHENEKVIDIVVSDFNSYALTSNQRVFAWGLNNRGQIGDGTTDNRLTPVDITSNFNLLEDEFIIKVVAGKVLTSKGRVFSWGSNFSGQVLDGTMIDRPTPIDITEYFNLQDNE